MFDNSSGFSESKISTVKIPIKLAQNVSDGVRSVLSNNHSFRHRLIFAGAGSAIKFSTVILSPMEERSQYFAPHGTNNLQRYYEIDCRRDLTSLHFEDGFRIRACVQNTTRT